MCFRALLKANPGLGWLLRRAQNHSSILAWENPWTGSPDWLQFIWLERVWYDWASKHSTKAQEGRSLINYFLSYPFCSQNDFKCSLFLNADWQIWENMREIWKNMRKKGWLILNLWNTKECLRNHRYEVQKISFFCSELLNLLWLSTLSTISFTKILIFFINHLFIFFNFLI